MASRPRTQEGYGSTSEQRQRTLEGDAIPERSPRTPEEAEAARSTPDKGGQVVQVNALPGPLDGSRD